MKIYIDPQHGGKDTGLQYNGIYEKDVALGAALILMSSIKTHEVSLSREKDTLAIANDPERVHGSGSIDVQYRADQANKNKVDLFIGLGLYSPGRRKKDKLNDGQPLILTLRATPAVSRIAAGLPGSKVIEYNKILFKPLLEIRNPCYYQLLLLNMDRVIILLGDIADPGIADKSGVLAEQLAKTLDAGL